ncbi:hypothetical protein N0B44_22385 [Roseibacterium beibuensis]|uniref:hypothetical protein n=1 Tax=[Roseibacterium] beibuensis TaxID=1193142 RepID=UPI00217ED955|nr:hypothetical protein [Roseibacterium beibuensis]MCS6625666.1 hypothetical protein [Roseibacterium beibuensis]
MTPALIAALMIAAAPQEPPAPEVDPTELQDVVIDARRIEQLARQFIDDVAAPTRTRGLARWNSRLCVGVLNLRPDIGQAIVDRISDVARSLGVEAGEPGCRANALIVAADDGPAMAAAMVESRRRGFDIGSLKITQNDEALEAFMAEDRPVRWWQISIPVDSQTGGRAIRLAGDLHPGTNEPTAPRIAVFAASRIQSQIRDDLRKVFIIVDIDDVEGLTTTQLSDYLAMVTLAQIDARGDASGYDTVLNLFSDREGVSGLTRWDMAYLTGLYEAEQNRINPNAQARGVADAAVRAHRADPADPSPEE